MVKENSEPMDEATKVVDQVLRNVMGESVGHLKLWLPDTRWLGICSIIMYNLFRCDKNDGNCKREGV